MIAIARTADPVEVKSIRGLSISFFHLRTPYVLASEFVDRNAQAVDYVCAAPGYYLHDLVTQENAGHYSSDPLHQHDALELMFVLEGYVVHHIEEHCFICKAGHCYILNKWTRHGEEFSSDYKAIFIMLGDALLQSLLQNHLEQPEDRQAKMNPLFTTLPNLLYEKRFQKSYIELLPLSYTGEMQRQFHALFDKMLAETARGGAGSPFFLSGYLAEFLDLLADADKYSVKSVSLQSSREEYLFLRICSYLEIYHGKVTRPQLEALLHYSGDYINRIVLKHTGRSLIAYAQTYSIDYAAEMLRTTEHTVSHIMQEIGFTNKTQFYKLFAQQRGVTPNEYRRACRELPSQ